MRKHFAAYLAPILAAAVFLVACTSTTPAEETPTPEEPTVQEPTEMPTSLPPTAEPSPTEEPAPTEGPEEITLFVGPVQVDCVGVAPQKCLLVREDPGQGYTMFYDQIEGFEFEKGYIYELRVLKEPVANPPADASSIRWVLVSVEDKSRSLEGNLWGLEAYATSEGEMAQVPSGAEVAAYFTEGQVSGNNGCNNYAAMYIVEGDSITITLGPSTLMACPPPLDEVETQYMANLAAATTFSVEDDQLQLFDNDGNLLLVFSVVEPAPLTGTPWQLTGYNNGRGGFTSLVIGTEITAVFGEDGSLAGSAGCNNYMTSYQVSGDSMAIEPAATTRMMCAEPEGIMEQESEYLTALTTAATFEIAGNKLELFDADGSRVASYVTGVVEPGGSLSEESLKNMTYQSGVTESGDVTLVDGEYRAPAAPGSASEIVVTLTGPVAYGQLADGREAAAVILASSGGGSGTFIDLALVADQDGQPVNVATTMLGDRVQVNSVAFQDGQIVVDMITQGPDDPMCCPTQQVLQTYALEGDSLTLVSTEVLGTVAPGDEGD